MKVLIAGGSGLIGGRIFGKLKGEHEVYGLRESPYANVVDDVYGFRLS